MSIAAMRPGDPFEKPGVAAEWRPDTQRLTEGGDGLYLGWLMNRGPLDCDIRPVDRVDQDRVRAFVQDYSSGRAPSTVALEVRGIAYMIRATHAPTGCRG
jgi:hypothetical protein